MTELLNDILRQPEELSKSLTYALGPGRTALERAAGLVREAAHVYIAGIGSSWHAGMAVESIFRAGGRAVCLVDASELLHFGRLAPDSALIVLSRSGRSAEIVPLIPKARRDGARVVAITNTPASPLARDTDATLLLGARFDHLVSISMYSALALTGGLLASTSTGGLDEGVAEGIQASLAGAGNVLASWIEDIENSDWLTADAPTYFLARGGSLASCHEARLLWEEAAKAPATAMGTGGFRHGPQECVGEGMRIGLWLDGAKMRDEDAALARDLRKLGVKTLVIGQQPPPEAGDLVVRLPAIPAAWQFLIDIMPAQIAAEQLSRRRRVDCDSFRICPYIVEGEGGLLGATLSSHAKARNLQAGQDGA
ncbi:MAG: SIS domain-containing protein [Bryobacteraceae bacterium]|nr:SIS domain-containing protein [Bryobacteraceae bacterium]